MYVTCKVVAELFVDTDDVAEAIEIASSEAYGEWSVITLSRLVPSRGRDRGRAAGG